MGIKSLVENGVIEVWDDIYDLRLDDKAAPDLSDILKTEDRTYSDAEEFFKRTYLTKSIEELIEDVADSLRSGIRGGGIFLLTSLFGGGKTHTLITLYHAFNNPDGILSDELAASVAEVRPFIIVMDASRASLVPHPDEPYKTENFTIRTIWGMLAHRLGAYAKIKHLDSEKAPAPETDLLKDILSEAKEPVLILLDEIVHYVFNMHKSRLKDYGEKVLLFLDYLARAVESTPNIALVASVQAEYRIVDGQKLLFEEDIFRGYAFKILNVLSRESTRLVTPVAPDDVIKVLQRRIFKKVPEEETFRARDRIYKIYRENPELFGVESDWQFSPESGKTATARDTYPFHPKYVEVLQEFVTRNRDLQKTRDAIRITRKVVRRLLKGREDADFIMPWHIDLRDRDIRNRVLTDSRREFRDVAGRDIVTEEGKLGSVAECSKPDLALRIATSVLLKTYTYETFKEPLKVFPDMKTIALTVYEPETFSREGLHPSDIKTIVEEMLGRLPHFTSESNRYWFTPYPSVIDYVDKKAKEKLGTPLKLYNVITKRAKELLVRKKEKETGEVFSEKNAVIVGHGEWEEVVVEDDPSPKLVVLIKPEVSEEEIRKLILMRGEGRRTFRNTVAVIYPCQAKCQNFESLLHYAAKIKAAEEVKGTLSEYYRDREIRSLQERKLKKYIQDNENLLNQQLLAVLTNVAYPARVNSDDVKFVTTTPLSSIISQAEAGLKDPSTGPKLRTDFSFDDLADFLRRNQNWDLVNGERRTEFREIVNVFYTTTAAPFTTKKAIERALLEGIESSDIGVEMDGELYWKDVDGAKIQKLKDTAEILPYRFAADILKDRLLKESGEHVIGKKIHIIWYEVELAGRSIRLEDLIVQKDWEKVLKEGKIIRKEKVVDEGFFLKLSHSSVEVMPAETVEVNVEVKPVNEYSEEVKLTADCGHLSPTRERPPFNAVWSITAPSDPGDHRYTVEAISNRIKVKADLSVRVKSPEEDIEVNKLDSYTGAKLTGISTNDLMNLKKMLDVVSRLNLNAEADVRIDFGENISFTGKGMDVKIAGLFVQKFADIQRSLPSLEARSVNGSVNIEPVILDHSKITAFAPLKAKFRLRR